MAARVYNPATWRRELLDALRSGVLACYWPCRSDVHTKRCVNVVRKVEAYLTRFAKEGCNGSGRKRSKQKSPRSAVVGSHLWMVISCQPDRYERTWLCFAMQRSDLPVLQATFTYYSSIWQLVIDVCYTNTTKIMIINSKCKTQNF